jgi:hypothetical protein
MVTFWPGDRFAEPGPGGRGQQIIAMAAGTGLLPCWPAPVSGRVGSGGDSERGRRRQLPGLLAGLLALLGILIAIPVTVVGGYLPAAVTGHRPVWIGLLACLAAVIAALTWWLASRAADRKPGPWLSVVPAVPGWVDRGELAEVVSALTAAGSGPVALTTGLGPRRLRLD